MPDSFGQTIRQSREGLGHTLREFAAIVGINFTYLSKLETDNADYPPSTKVIKCLAKNLNLPEDRLAQLAGRIDPETWQIFLDLMQQYPDMSLLLRRMRSPLLLPISKSTSRQKAAQLLG